MDISQQFKHQINNLEEISDFRSLKKAEMDKLFSWHFMILDNIDWLSISTYTHMFK